MACLRFSHGPRSGLMTDDDTLLTLSAVSPFRPRCLCHHLVSHAQTIPTFFLPKSREHSPMVLDKWMIFVMTVTDKVKEIVLLFWSHHLACSLSLRSPVWNMSVLNPWGSRQGWGVRVGKKEQKIDAGKATAFFWKQGPLWKWRLHDPKVACTCWPLRTFPCKTHWWTNSSGLRVSDEKGSIAT